jgi:prophage regulatory protein
MIEATSNCTSASVADGVSPVRDRRKDRLLRINAVVSRTGLSIGTIYRREGDGTFPRRERIGLRCVAWYESDIDDFIADPLRYRAPVESKLPGSGTPSQMRSAQT